MSWQWAQVTSPDYVGVGVEALQPTLLGYVDTKWKFIKRI